MNCSDCLYDSNIDGCRARHKLGNGCYKSAAAVCSNCVYENNLPACRANQIDRGEDCYRGRALINQRDFQPLVQGYSYEGEAIPAPPADYVRQPLVNSICEDCGTTFKTALGCTCKRFPVNGR